MLEGKIEKRKNVNTKGMEVQVVYTKILNPGRAQAIQNTGSDA